MVIERMLAQLLLHEGLKLHAYLDTEGFYTLGVGYNLSSRGVDFYEQTIGRRLRWQEGDVTTPITTRPEALRVLRADVLRVEAAVSVHFPTYLTLDPVRQRVVIDMAFNMGFGVAGFKAAAAAVKARDWSKAARELYKSKWARQVGDGEGGKFDRCDRLARIMLTGQEPTDIPTI
jgi:lysozyme